MQKTLLVLATIGAFANISQAANVTVYGAVDTGFSDKYVDTEFTTTVDGQPGFRISEHTHRFGFESGLLGSSKFGLKGEEVLGNGYRVGFQLENGFQSDTGSFKDDKRLFDREARLSLFTPYGTISAGRMGALSSGSGTYGLFQAYSDVFKGGVSTIMTGFWQGTTRYDNMITLVSPEMNGLKLYGQYSFATNGDESSSVRNVDRYWGIGSTYDNGPLGLALVVDSVKPKSVKGYDVNDSLTVSFGGHMEFDSVKPFFGVQYGKHVASGLNLIDSTGIIKKSFQADKLNGEMHLVNDMKGYVVSVGSEFKFSTGILATGLYYSQTKGDIGGTWTKANGTVKGVNLVHVSKAQNYGVGLVNSYPLSKRTTLYSGVGYKHTQIDGQFENAVTDIRSRLKYTSTEVLFGINHQF